MALLLHCFGDLTLAAVHTENISFLDAIPVAHILYTQTKFVLLAKMQLSKDMACLNCIWFTENKHQVQRFQYHQSQHKYNTHTNKQRNTCEVS